MEILVTEATAEEKIVLSDLRYLARTSTKSGVQYSFTVTYQYEHIQIIGLPTAYTYFNQKLTDNSYLQNKLINLPAKHLSEATEVELDFVDASIICETYSIILEFNC